MKPRADATYRMEYLAALAVLRNLPHAVLLPQVVALYYMLPDMLKLWAKKRGYILKPCYGEDEEGPEDLDSFIVHFTEKLISNYTLPSHAEYDAELAHSGDALSDDYPLAFIKDGHVFEFRLLGASVLNTMSIFVSSSLFICMDAGFEIYPKLETENPKINPVVFYQKIEGFLDQVLVTDGKLRRRDDVAQLSAENASLKARLSLAESLLESTTEDLEAERRRK